MSFFGHICMDNTLVYAAATKPIFSLFGFNSCCCYGGLFFVYVFKESFKNYLKRVFFTFGTIKLWVFYTRKFSGLKYKWDFLLLASISFITLLVNPFRFVCLGIILASLRYHDGTEVLVFYLLVLLLTLCISLPAVQKHILLSYGSHSLRLLGWNINGQNAHKVAGFVVLAGPLYVGGSHAEKAISADIELKRVQRAYFHYIGTTVPYMNTYNASLLAGQAPMLMPQPLVYNPDFSVGAELKNNLRAGIPLQDAISDVLKKIKDAQDKGK
jgi:hypothetical protein